MKKIFSILFFTIVSILSFAQEKSTKDCDTCVYDLVAIQKQPEFSGGDAALIDFLKLNFKYPSSAKDMQLQGKVFVTFVINKIGNVTEIKIYKGINPPKEKDGKKLKKKLQKKYEDAAKEMNDEALRVVGLMPKWSPGMQNDKYVNVRYILPISYKLQ